MSSNSITFLAAMSTAMPTKMPKKDSIKVTTKLSSKDNTNGNTASISVITPKNKQEPNLRDKHSKLDNLITFMPQYILDIKSKPT
eukprot:2852802-Ditylum_brightwellii.AAC.1